ncbi:MAG: hypothetical protein ACNS63_10435 [Candidatus Nitrospinota bacterium M3_3B_026]
MRKIVSVIAPALAALLFLSCSGPDEPQEKELTTKERAERVGKFSDKVMTKGLEEKLPDIVEKAEERAGKLDEAAGR